MDALVAIVFAVSGAGLATTVFVFGKVKRNAEYEWRQGFDRRHR